MKVTAYKTAIFRESDNLFDFVVKHVPKISEGDILVVTSKIAALAEGRTSTDTSPEAKDKLIQSDSELAVQTKYVWATVRQGILMPSAGIDESNADGKIVMLPVDSYDTAEALRSRLKEHYKLEKLGVILTDSRTMPIRAGTIGQAVGYAGFVGLRDYRGKKDIFGREFVFETMNLPDALASAAVLIMGEGAEQKPLAVIEGAEVEFADKTDRDELKIDPKDDMYQPLLDFRKHIK